jgi:hypothetical protein
LLDHLQQPSPATAAAAAPPPPPPLLSPSKLPRPMSSGAAKHTSLVLMRHPTMRVGSGLVGRNTPFETKGADICVDSSSPVLPFSTPLTSNCPLSAVPTTLITTPSNGGISASPDVANTPVL